MSVKFCCQPPTSYPAAEVQCVLDCANGTCQEPPESMVWSHNVVSGYCGYQAAQAGQLKGSCTPCSVADLKRLHADITSGKKSASPINWAAFLQLMLTLLTQLLGNLIPPTPTPVPTP